MLYSKDDVLTAVREELAEANRKLGITDGFTDNDYQYLGVIAAAWERLLVRQPNGSKPHVSGTLPPDYTVPFVEWIAKNDEWMWNNEAGIWKKDGWRSRTTLELYDLFRRQ